MKVFFSFIIAHILIVLPSSVIACSIEIPPLRKDFRSAASVFRGRVMKLEEVKLDSSRKDRLPDAWKTWDVFTSVTFDVDKRWKGTVSKEHVVAGVAYFGCGCPGSFSKYEVGKEYLVFQRKKDFVTICDAEKVGSEYVGKRMRKLDGFWFRTWAQVYPF